MYRSLLIICTFIVISGLTRSADAELTSQDRSAILYSTQFGIDARGIPIISVSIVEGMDTIRFHSKSALRILPVDDAGPEILTPADYEWNAKVLHSKPAELTWWIGLERQPHTSIQELQRSTEAWQKSGLDVKVIELGSVFGLLGQVMDTRVILLVLNREFKDRKKALAESNRIAKQYRLETFLHSTLSKQPEGMIELSSEQNAIRLRNRNVFWIEPEPGKTITIRKVEFGKGYKWHGFQDRSYRGRIYITIDRNGKLTAVNSISADEMLKGIVPAEIFPTASIEALKAQAVTARGILLAKIGTRHLADPYLICSDVHCQVYSGVNREHKQTSKAVISTRGELLMSGERITDTVYSSSCGGHTEHNENAWSQFPNAALRGIYDGNDASALAKLKNGVESSSLQEWILKPPPAFCSHASVNQKHFRWTLTISAQEMDHLMNAVAPVGAVQSLVAKKRGVSGRIIDLQINGSKSSTVIHGELNIRRRLKGLKSSMVIFEPKKNASGTIVEWIINGGGFGHGVGMCQTGAIGRAEQGQTYHQILEQYYRDSTVKRIY